MDNPEIKKQLHNYIDMIEDESQLQLLAVILQRMTPKNNKASHSFINAAMEFEKIERILLYFKVSNYFINHDLFNSIKKLKDFNNELEIPYEFNNKQEEEFLEIKYYENTLSTMMYVRTDWQFYKLLQRNSIRNCNQRPENS